MDVYTGTPDRSSTAGALVAASGPGGASAVASAVAAPAGSSNPYVTIRELQQGNPY
jgi:hypothetical protein